jgi:hypothetical protein
MSVAHSLGLALIITCRIGSPKMTSTAALGVFIASLIAKQADHELIKFHPADIVFNPQSPYRVAKGQNRSDYHGVNPM